MEGDFTSLRACLLVARVQRLMWVRKARIKKAVHPLRLRVNPIIRIVTRIVFDPG